MLLLRYLVLRITSHSEYCTKSPSVTERHVFTFLKGKQAAANGVPSQARWSPPPAGRVCSAQWNVTHVSVTVFPCENQLWNQTSMFKSDPATWQCSSWFADFTDSTFPIRKQSLNGFVFLPVLPVRLGVRGKDLRPGSTVRAQRET